MSQQSPDSSRSRQVIDLEQLVESLTLHLANSEARYGDDAARTLVQTILDAVTASGLEIRDPGSSASAPSIFWQGIQERLNAIRPLRLRELMSIWRELSMQESAGPRAVYIELGQRLLKSGQPLIAYDTVKSGLQHRPDDLRLRQLQALALARSGATSRARELLEALVAEGHQDEETLGLLARTDKDLSEQTDDPDERKKWLSDAHHLYRQGYDAALASGNDDGALYAGINAATTALLLGQHLRARQIAAEVEEICQRKLAIDADYWALATLGECDLINGRLEKARTHYAAAAQLAGNNFADIASTKRNASMLLEALGEHSIDLEEWFPVPDIVVFTGHLIDRPDAAPRFPASQIPQVAEEIRRQLGEISAGFGLAAAACGGDLLFLEALNELGGESHIVLPMPVEQFIDASVMMPGERDWQADFHQMLDAAAKLTVVNEFSREPRPEHFEYANHVMTGLAMLQARLIGARVVPMALWDERPARGPGGTGSLVAVWRELGLEPRIINPLRLAGDGGDETDSQGPDDSLSMLSSPSEILVRAMLFADVVGYSKLDDEEIPLFVRDFMGSINECVRQSGVRIETSNTWGDAIYFVFQTVADAGMTALRITEHVNSIDWQQRGFKAPMTLRTGLHVGPVFRVIDPVTKSTVHTGAHVSRAARIEPIAPPGEVYASEAFAAVAAADNVTRFQCDYVGVTPMAKGYGEFATYHVRRRH